MPHVLLQIGFGGERAGADGTMIHFGAAAHDGSGRWPVDCVRYGWRIRREQCSAYRVLLACGPKLQVRPAVRDAAAIERATAEDTAGGSIDYSRN